MTTDAQPTEKVEFNWTEQQEQLRCRLRAVLKRPGVTLQRIADLDPDLKKRWMKDFSRGAYPTANIANLEALQRALGRLDELKAFEQQLVTPAESSNATV